MSNRSIIITMVALVTLLFTYSARAEEPKAEPVMGFVIAAETGNFTMHAKKKVVKVLVSNKTSYTAGLNKATDQRPQAGDHVMVYGKTLDNGDIEATEVMVHRMPMPQEGAANPHSM